MEIVCLDLEGVLVPEIWIAFAEETGIPELKRTTRDEPDYDKLMKYRIGILKEHGLGLKEIQETIAKIDPIPGAKEFLDKLRAMTQVIIISDTFLTINIYIACHDECLCFLAGWCKGTFHHKHIQTFLHCSLNSSLSSIACLMSSTPSPIRLRRLSTFPWGTKRSQTAADNTLISG